MNYFTDESNNVFAYTNEDVKNGCGENLKSITEAKKTELLTITLTESDLSEIEYQWASNEIKGIDEQINKCLDSSTRAIATESEWREYRELLRNYATSYNGVYSLRSNKPVAPS